MVELKQYGTSDGKAIGPGQTKPTAQEVDDFHTNSDVNLRAESLHHTLGASPTQASPGNHTHDGNDSLPILTGFAITGSRGSDAWRLSVNGLLVRLGAEDQSTS